MIIIYLYYNLYKGLLGSTFNYYKLKLYKKNLNFFWKIILLNWWIKYIYLSLCLFKIQKIVHSYYYIDYIFFINYNYSKYNMSNKRNKI
jgi:hypothetical protein